MELRHPIRSPGQAHFQVKLTRFAATKENLIAVLNWNTSSEDNSDRFEIEHSTNGKKWNVIGSISAKNTASESMDYQFNDLTPVDGENIYRLRMVDLDGTFAYSQMRSLNFETFQSVVVYPNPVSENLRVTVSEISNIKIYDMNGRLALSPAINSDIDVRNLIEGNYILKITRKDSSISRTKFRVTK